MLVCLSKIIQQKVPKYQTFASKILTKKNKGIVSKTWLLWSGPQSTYFPRDETGLVCLPLSWGVHCNFTGDGKCKERGWACTPHPHQPRLILPSSLNVRQKAAVATLCTLWSGPNIAKIEIVIFLNREVRIISYHSIGRDY